MEVASRECPGPAAPPPPAAAASPRPSAPGSWRQRGSPRVAAQDNLKIHVTGYPSYTKPADLVRAFSRVTPVTVDRMTERSAVLQCGTARGAQLAVEQSGALNVYAQFLTVRPHSAAAEHQQRRRDRDAAAAAVAAAKRDFTRSKTKESLIADPAQLDLSGDFHSQVDMIMASVRLTQDEVQRLALLYMDVEQALSALWPGCVARPFGSITTGLGIKTSDADCFLDVPARFRHPQANFVSRAKRVLQQNPSVFAEILTIPRANTPLVKFHHVPTGTNCDLSFKSPLGARNSKLITFLLHGDPRLLPVAVLLKYWGKVHQLTGTGRLSNYALTMLVVFYLQQPPAALLPPVRRLQLDVTSSFFVDGWDTGFEETLLPSTAADISIADLLAGFFHFYAQFDWERLVVCPYLGRPLPRDAFRDPSALPAEYTLYRENVTGGHALPLKVSTAFCVQDPFEQSHNVASGVSHRMAAEIVEYIKFAARAHQQAGAGFLPVILTTRPKIARGKSHPEYRLNLFPGILRGIAGEWRARVRDAIFDVFETILKLKLGKIEEKSNPDSKKEKEKYWTEMSAPVWRRRRAERSKAVPFLERESRVTQHILQECTEPIQLEFQVVATYSSAPRGATLSVRFSRGDADLFREFGRFYVSVIQSWFMTLVAPHSNTKHRQQGGTAPPASPAGRDPSDSAFTGDDDDDDEDDDDEVCSDDVTEQAVDSVALTVGSCCLNE